MGSEQAPTVTPGGDEYAGGVRLGESGARKKSQVAVVEVEAES